MKFYTCIIALFSLNSFSQSVIFEENFNSGIPTTWTLINNDNLTPVVDSFSNAWISFNYSTYSCAASTSYYTPSGTSSDYLISPKISLNSFTKLVWSARSWDATYPDSYVVLISTTDSLITSFTDTLMTVASEFYYWHKRSIQLDLEGYANQDVYIAIKNITTDGYILLVDDFKILGSDFASAETEEESLIEIYPNPVSEYLTITGVSDSFRINIYSVQGELILTENSTTVPVMNLPSGVYTYQLISEDKVYTGKFIKQ